jgi:putative transposase
LGEEDRKSSVQIRHCKCGSSRWNRLKKSIRAMQKKATDQRKDFQHKLSRKIVENTKANTIIVGDLDVKEMAQEKEKSKKSPLQKARRRGLNRGIKTQVIVKIHQILNLQSRRDSKK